MAEFEIVATGRPLAELGSIILRGDLRPDFVCEIEECQVSTLKRRNPKTLTFFDKIDTL